jgi:uncharacterized protein (DUF2236 family)
MRLDLDRLRRKIVDPIEEVGGRHDQHEVYALPLGDPGLIPTGPDSISWELHGDMASVGGAGMGAIIMEILHPSVMAGVFTQSTYETQPLRRARNTLGYVIQTTFGNTDAATRLITRVHNVHSRIEGVRPDGRAYKATDPELLAWVHTCIPMAIMQFFDTYRRPLSVDEKNRYLAEQAIIGRMGGADWVPETVDELADYVEAMRPQLAVNEQTTRFLDFLLGTGKGTAMDRLTSRITIEHSMALMPEWAQRMTGLQLTDRAKRTVDPLVRAQLAMIRWGFQTPPYKAMAEARARGISLARAA